MEMIHIFTHKRNSINLNNRPVAGFFVFSTMQAEKTVYYEY